MKKFISLLSLILLALSLSAATCYVGFEAGADYNMVIAGKGYRDYSYTGKFNFTSSLPVLIGLTPSIGIETGLSYYARDYGYRRTVKDGSDTYDTLDYVRYNHFIELPVALCYTFNRPDSDNAFFLSGGGFVGYWVSGKRAGLAYNMGTEPGLTPFDEKTDLNSYNRFQAGIIMSLGMKWQLLENMTCHIRLGYSLSLTDLNRYQKYGAYPIHNSTLYLTCGLMWGIKK